MEEEEEQERQEPSQKPSGAPSPLNGRPPQPNGDDASGSLLPVPFDDDEAVGGQLVESTGRQLQMMLHEAEDGESLVELQKQAATLLHATERQEKLKHMHFTVSVFNLEVQRKLGALLLQTDARGGDRAKLHAAILLPGNLEPTAATRYRKMARVEESEFRQYVERQRSLSKIPSAAGCLSFSQKAAAGTAAPKRSRKKRKPATGDIEVSPKVLDAIERCLGDIDVCVGEAKVRCSKRVTGAELKKTDVQGSVLVAARVDPDAWLNIFVELRRGAQCEQVVVLLLAETHASWFQQFRSARWHLCFLAESQEPTLAAYLGKRSESFFAAMHEQGIVLSSHQ